LAYDGPMSGSVYFTARAGESIDYARSDHDSRRQTAAQRLVADLDGWPGALGGRGPGPAVGMATGAEGEEAGVGGRIPPAGTARPLHNSETVCARTADTTDGEGVTRIPGYHTCMRKQKRYRQRQYLLPLPSPAARGDGPAYAADATKDGLIHRRVCLSWAEPSGDLRALRIGEGTPCNAGYALQRRPHAAEYDSTASGPGTSWCRGILAATSRSTGALPGHLGLETSAGRVVHNRISHGDLGDAQE
jgi:hypothetical protein